MKHRDILLFGGGLDSTALLLELVYNSKKDPLLVHVDYGQKACDSELKHLKECARRLSLSAFVPLSVPLTFSNASIMKGSTPAGTDQNQNRLELRNAVLLSLVASFAATSYDSATIYVATHQEPEGASFRDAVPRNLHRFIDGLAGLTTCKLSLMQPFGFMSRQAVAALGEYYQCQLAATTGDYYDFMGNAHTCYEAEACGKCSHCVERKQLIQRGG